MRRLTEWAIVAAAVLVGLLIPLGGGLAAPTFQFADNSDTGPLAAFAVFHSDSTGTNGDTATIARNGTVETTAVLNTNAFDSAVSLTAGRHQFVVTPYSVSGGTVAVTAQANTVTIFVADSPTTISTTSPAALAGVGQVTGSASTSFAAGDSSTLTFSGTVFDIGIDTPSTVRFRVQNNTGTVVVDSTVAVDSTGTGGWSGPLDFLADSVGSNTVTISATDATAPFFGDTKVIVITVSVSALTQTNSAPVQSFTDPTDTSTTIAPTETTNGTDSYVQVALDSGGTADTTSSATTFSALANESGTGATHAVSIDLAGDETATVYIYTGVETMSMLVSIRETILEGSPSFYTESLLPPGTASSADLIRAFDATAFALLFADSAGNLFATDSTTIVDVGDTLAYTVCWTLSETVTRHFKAAGFDTAAGSSSFGVWAADTFGGRWQFVKNATAVTGGNTMTVCGVGLTKDVHLGLNHSSSSTAASDGGTCLLERSGLFTRPALSALRAWRDRALGTSLGRFLAAIYYLLFG